MQQFEPQPQSSSSSGNEANSEHIYEQPREQSSSQEERGEQQEQERVYLSESESERSRENQGSQESQGQATLQEQEYVGVGKRWLAVLIDGFVISIITNMVSGWFRFESFLSAQLNLWPGVQLPMYEVGGLTLVGLIYFVVMEGLWSATLGKMLFKIRVVSLDGQPLSWLQVVLRNLLRVVDGQLGYLVAAVFVWNSSREQRLGDIVAKTAVVNVEDRSEYKLRSFSGSPDIPDNPDVPKW